jgi:ribosomal protein L21E
MSVYTPDNWVILKIKYGTGYFYKVLGGWSGSYLEGDSWRMNSGITSVEEDEHYYYFHGHTGSCYRCNKGSYALRVNIAHVWTQVKGLHGDKVHLMPEDTDWMKVKLGKT